MGKTIENLWAECVESECSKMDTTEERVLARRVSEKRKLMDEVLDGEQRCVLDSYMDALCELNALFARKAFAKGCEFTASFLLEATDSGKSGSSS